MRENPAVGSTAILPRAFPVALLALAGALSMPFAASAAGSDELWEVSTQMNIPGMPAGMGGAPQQVCRDRDPRKETVSRKDMQDCKVTDVKESGTRFSMTMSCPRGPVVIDQTYNASRTEYKGTIRMSDGGREMVMNTSGRKIGSCDAPAARKEQSDKNAKLIAKADADGRRMQAEQKETLKQEEQRRIQSCAKAVETMDRGGLGTYGNCYRKSDNTCRQLTDFESKQYPAAASACAAKVSEFCNRYQTPEGFMKARGSEDAAQMCSLSAAKVKASLCPRALQTESLDFLGRYCPAEAKPLAQKYCTGRDYTSREGGKYANFCGNYLTELESGDESNRQGVSAGSAGREERKAAAASGSAATRGENAGQKKSADEAVQQGITKGLGALKGLFGR